MRIKEMKQPFTIEMTNSGIKFFLHVKYNHTYMYDSLYIIDKKYYFKVSNIHYN